MIRIRDIMEAERVLDEAEKQRQEFLQNPDQWSAYESLDKTGMRQLNLNDGYFDQVGEARRKVASAEAHLRSLWAQLLGSQEG